MTGTINVKPKSDIFGQYDKIRAVTYENNMPTYVLTGWNIPNPDFEVDICADCLLASDTAHGDIVEEHFVTHVTTMDDILKFAEDHDLMDRLHFDSLGRLLVGNNRNIAVSYLLSINRIEPTA